MLLDNVTGLMVAMLGEDSESKMLVKNRRTPGVVAHSSKYITVLECPEARARRESIMGHDPEMQKEEETIGRRGRRNASSWLRCGIVVCWWALWWWGGSYEWKETRRTLSNKNNQSKCVDSRFIYSRKEHWDQEQQEHEERSTTFSRKKTQRRRSMGGNQRNRIERTSGGWWA